MNSARYLPLKRESMLSIDTYIFIQLSSQVLFGVINNIQNYSHDLKIERI